MESNCTISLSIFGKNQSFPGTWINVDIDIPVYEKGNLLVVANQTISIRAFATRFGAIKNGMNILGVSPGPSTLAEY